MARYLINVLATQDIREIVNYVSINNVDAGENFLQDFNRKCKQLVLFPNSGKIYDYIYPDLKGISLSGYIIFYRILADGIEILRVINGRRDLPTIFKESEPKN